MQPAERSESAPIYETLNSRYRGVCAARSNSTWRHLSPLRRSERVNAVPKQPTKPTRRRPLVEPIEPRVLYSAGLDVVLIEEDLSLEVVELNKIAVTNAKVPDPGAG